MPAIFEHHLTVTPEHIDRLGHVNNLEYLRWALAAAIAHSAVQGWPTEAYEKIGAGFVVRSHEIKYLQSAFEGDEVTVRTWVADFRRLSCMRRYRIIRRAGDVVLATAATEWAFVKFDGFSLARIPPEVAGAFEIVRDAEVSPRNRGGTERTTG
jgi:acyl-CoA thioester hydrolase